MTTSAIKRLFTGGYDQVAVAIKRHILRAVRVVFHFVIAPTVTADFASPGLACNGGTCRAVKFVGPKQGPVTRVPANPLTNDNFRDAGLCACSHLGRVVYDNDLHLINICRLRPNTTRETKGETPNRVEV